MKREEEKVYKFKNFSLYVDDLFTLQENHEIKINF